MRQVFQDSFHQPVKILEIGTWFAKGSTQIWLELAQPGSSITVLDSWKPYASPQDLQDETRIWEAVDQNTTDAFLSTFLALREYENEKRDRNILTNLIRGDSTSFLPMLRDDTFDFIYIDGDHKYEKAKADIVQAKRLVKKDYGVICGDDLDVLPTENFLQKARLHKDLDFLRSDHFHPGVLLAISEEFENVSMKNGTWWSVCREGKFGE
jgi:hypothetical protein